jgi:cytochrome c-type biogenesis protein CcmH/NrfG
VIPALLDLLATFYQAGNLDQVETVARSMLATIPDDIVSLQFLGLALYQTGRFDDAYRAFKQVATRFNEQPGATRPTDCEPAAAASYRAAIRADSGLAEGWWQIARVLAKLGFRAAAGRAYQAALAARGMLGPPLPLLAD